MPQFKQSFCRNCSALCAMTLTVDNNRILDVSPDGVASPYDAYMCAKGRSSVDFHNGEDRLTQCLKRGEEGAFKTIDSERALDEIAENS